MERNTYKTTKIYISVNNYSNNSNNTYDEDVDVYDKYIDVFEFFGNEEAQKTIFKAYAIDKQWYGKLEELIIGFKGDMDSRYIFPLFADKRAVCKKKCVKGGKCNICGRLEELASTLEEKHFMIKLDKK